MPVVDGGRLGLQAMSLVIDRISKRFAEVVALDQVSSSVEPGPHLRPPRGDGAEPAISSRSAL
jgi:hypothetical protein